jgi:hypothetical protein
MAHCIISRMLVYAGCVALQRSRHVIVSQMIVQAGCGALWDILVRMGQALDGIHTRTCWQRKP